MSLIDFCICNNCRVDIENIKDEKYPCDKYKNNFSSLECFNGTKYLISNLNLKNLQKESKLNQTNSIINRFYNNQKEQSGIN